MSLTRRDGFVALFATQLAGALVDNLAQAALAAAIVAGWQTTGPVGQAFGVGLFLAPFVGLSVVGGALADGPRAATLIPASRLGDLVGAGLLAGAAVTTGWTSLALLGSATVTLAARAALFGPLKYAALVDLLPRDQRVRGVALTTVATQIAVLVGSWAGLRLGVIDRGPLIAAGFAGTALVLGLLSFASARALSPLTPAASATPALRWSLRGEPVPVVRSVLALTWYWGAGAFLVAVLPGWVGTQLGADGTAASVVLALLLAGVGLGALICARWSFGRVELGLVPIGSVATTAGALILAAAPSVGRLGAGFLELSTSLSGLVTAAGVILLAAGAGLMVVPLYAFLIDRVPRERLGRVLGVGNTWNAAFGVALLLGAVAMERAGVAPWVALLGLAVANAAVAVVTYRAVPEFLLRFLMYLVAHVMYRVELHEGKAIPDDRPLVFVCNHVSFIDWMIIGSVIPRPLRFVMDKAFSEGFAGFVTRQYRVIPIASAKRDPELLERAFERIHEEIAAGWSVLIFPEGMLTLDGEIGEFRGGVERILARDPVPVVPLSLNGMWGSRFSRAKAGAGPRRRWFPRVHVTLGAMLPPEEAKAAKLQEIVTELWKRHPEP